jgi:hypothetical protein
MSTATATPNLAGAQTLNFGGVLPGSSGPDITVNPNFGPPGINFAGGIQINAPVDAIVHANIVVSEERQALRYPQEGKMFSETVTINDSSGRSLEIEISTPTVWYVRSRSDFGDGFVEVEA